MAGVGDRRGVQRDDVGLGEQPVETDQLTALGFTEVRVVGQHAHAERPGGQTHPASDAAVTHQPEHRAVELEGAARRCTGQALPSALGLCRQVLDHGEQQHQGVLGSRHRRGVRRVADDHSGGRSGGHVDVVVADPDARDHLHVRAQREGFGIPGPASTGKHGLRRAEVGVVGPDGDRPTVDEVAVRVG